MNFKIRKFQTKLTEIEMFEALKDNNSIFLDSSKEDERLSKYSYIGINPIEKFECIEGKVFINGILKEEMDPFDELERRIEKNKILYPSDSPLLAGYIGYISYDTGRLLEELPDNSSLDIEIPNMRFFLYENIVIIDLINKNTYITAIGKEDLNISIDKVVEKISNYKKIEIEEINESIEFNSNFTRETYIEAVKTMRNYIEEGDIYIANMTQRYICQTKKKSFDIYKKLREINKAPFSAFVDYGDFQIISSSPERFMQIQDRRVVTRPIKGTRPRGNNSKEDDFYRKELENSEKDKSELLMIVDLERNDLSKVCKKGSVNVTELFKIEEYETVFHLVSTIEGVLKDNISAVKCIKECFPGGSITGAPKIRAMEIIEELEGIKRNLYTGSIGYFDLRGNSDFNIVIRTILKKGDKAYLGVGGGITYESDEKDEYEETLQKAKALMEVLR
ncbi:aminodeoxychorismate synthase component I [uncultured Clostridium sp.]|uniref:aminodeoxychorismate synthase component I n=1 Tax=uncultured Clostridium sp. TaxID=59620 RepID=UPI002629CB8D|nr:aminodeoxychorismate synthase component I [uncultured Clostridium sp.]